jgi:oligopeptide transport system ATP-binding protein
MRLLEVENLQTTFDIHAGAVQAVRGVSLHVDEGEAVGIVGESGSGKSVTMLSVLHLLPGNARVTADRLAFGGTDLTHAGLRAFRALEGNKIGMVFQDPMTSLNPLMTVGRQMAEPLRIHRKMNAQQAKKRVLEILDMVDMPDPASRIRQYPHELSGGMRQRVMIGMSIACEPRLIIADEPTTALDVTIQAQILELLTSLKKRLNTSVILITHDLGVIAGMCGRVMVMYGGRIVEEGTTREIFHAPRHPYTWGLLRSIPQKSGTRRKLIPITGSPPDLIAPPPGCPFEPRCPHAMRICSVDMPARACLSDTHCVSCRLMDAGAPRVEWGGNGHE